MKLRHGPARKPPHCADRSTRRLRLIRPWSEWLEARELLSGGLGSRAAQVHALRRTIDTIGHAFLGRAGHHHGRSAHPMFDVDLGGGGGATRSASGQATNVPSPVAGALAPAQVANAYRFNQITIGGSPGNGANETIAIVDAYNDTTIRNDLTQFDGQYTLLAPPTFSIVNQTGGSTLPAKDPSGGWALETALDVEWSHAMAPAANILLVEANSSSNSDLLAAVDYAAAHANVVSMSWGGSEFSSETNATQYENHFIQSGVVFVASSGDNGAPPEWPAVSPNVIAVGGTSLTVDSSGNYQSESGWSGSGGGLSNYESQPTYQNKVVTQSSTRRGNPDVAYDANPATGVSVYDSTTYYPSYPFSRNGQYGWFEVGGTSAGAPQWSALFAIADQARTQAGEFPINASSPTEAQTILYKNPSVLHDITTGRSTGRPNYSAGTGYDLVTGLGTPLSDQVVAALVGSGTLETPPSTPTGLTATATHDGPISLSWSPVSNSTGYIILRSPDGANTFTPVIQVGASVTSVQNINVAPGSAYDYEVEAVNGVGMSSPSTATLGITAATPNVLYTDTFATAPFPGTTWNITTAGTGATWTQSETAGTVSQTNPAVGDPKKAFLTTVNNTSTTPFIVVGLVHIDTWTSGETARAGIAAFTNPTTGQGYNLVLTGRFSNTGIAVAPGGAVVNPHVEFLDDGVTWGADLALPPSMTFQVGSSAPWYGFELMISNGVLYGAVWQSSTGSLSTSDMPATWMGQQSGWTDRTSGAPGLNGGSSVANFNGATSNSTDSFKSFSVVS
jgi:subtilase family serine protease